MRDHYLAHARRAPKPLSDEERREKEAKEKQEHAAMVQRAVSLPPGWTFDYTPGQMCFRAPVTPEDRLRQERLRHHIYKKSRKE